MNFLALHESSFRSTNFWMPTDQLVGMSHGVGLDVTTLTVLASGVA